MAGDGVSVLRKLLFFLLFYQQIVYASSFALDKKIYSTILHSIFPEKKTIHLYTDSKQKESLFAQIKGVQLVQKERADILIIGKTDQDINDEKSIIFVDNFHAFKFYKKIAIGGFYWKKGRPNLVFIRENLQKHHIVLPPAMQKYIYDNL